MMKIDTDEETWRRFSGFKINQDAEVPDSGDDAILVMSFDNALYAEGLLCGKDTFPGPGVFLKKTEQNSEGGVGYYFVPWSIKPPQSRDSGWRFSDTSHEAEYVRGLKRATYTGDVELPIAEPNLMRKPGNYDFNKYGVYAIYGKAATGKSLFLNSLVKLNDSPIWFLGEREHPSVPFTNANLSLFLYQMLDCEETLVVLDSVAFLSVMGTMGAGLAKQGISRDPIALLNSLQAVFRATQKIAMIVINPLGDPDDNYITGLQGGATGIFFFDKPPTNARTKNNDSGSTYLQWNVLVQTPGQRRTSINQAFVLPKYDPNQTYKENK